MAHCIGTYPKPIARLIRWAIKRNPTRTVSCLFRGRKPKKGQRWDRFGTLKINRARRVAIYLIWDPHAPVNKEHERQRLAQIQKMREYEDQQRRIRETREMIEQESRRREEQKIEPAKCAHALSRILYNADSNVYACGECSRPLSLAEIDALAK